MIYNQNIRGRKYGDEHEETYSNYYYIFHDAIAKRIIKCRLMEQKDPQLDQYLQSIGDYETHENPW